MAIRIAFWEVPFRIRTSRSNLGACRIARDVRKEPDRKWEGLEKEGEVDRSGGVMYALGGPDIRDVFLGGKVLACGGGGEIEWAEPFVREIESRDHRGRVATSRDLKDRDRVCVPGGIGAGRSPEARGRLTAGRWVP